jgi:hypothetical protein
VVYAAVWLGLAFWFFDAPAPRFGYAFSGSLLALGAAPFLLLVLRHYPRSPRMAGLALVLLLLAYQAVSFYHLTSPAALAAQAVLPQAYPQVATKSLQLGTERMFSPREGDQCWYEPFPCTPSLDANVHLRGASLADGFKIVP